MAECAANCATPATVTPAPVRRLRIMLPVPLPDALDYLAPDGAPPPEPGSFVRVTLGSRMVTRAARASPGDEPEGYDCGRAAFGGAGEL